MIVRHTRTFSAAHSLPNLPPDHPCSRVHGHNWTVTIAVEGPVDPTTGWVIDFGNLKAAMGLVLDPLDHRNLNDTIPNPTSEALAQYVADRINATSLVGVGGRRLVSVVVSEGGTCDVEWRA